MTSVVVQRLEPSRDSADNCGGSAVAWGFLWRFRRSSSWTSLTRPLCVCSSTRWSMSLLCCAMEFHRCSSSTVMTSPLSCTCSAQLRTPLGQIVPASCSSSELSAHQMAPAETIAHSRAHLCPHASSLSLSSLVSPLQPLGLGLLGRCDPRSFFFCDVTDAGPASHRVRLWQGGPASYCCLRVLVFLEFVCPLASPEAEGRWQWR